MSDAAFQRVTVPLLPGATAKATAPTWETIEGGSPGGYAAARLRFPSGWLFSQHGSDPIYIPDPVQDGGAGTGTTAILAAIADLKQELQTMSQTNQQHADAIAAQLTTIDATLKTGIAAITAEIADLKTANPAVDFSGVDAAVATLGTDVAAAAAIPPAAGPAPAA